MYLKIIFKLCVLDLKLNELFQKKNPGILSVSNSLDPDQDQQCSVSPNLGYKYSEKFVCKAILIHVISP